MVLAMVVVGVRDGRRRSLVTCTDDENEDVSCGMECGALPRSVASVKVGP